MGPRCVQCRMPPRAWLRSRRRSSRHYYAKERPCRCHVRLNPKSGANADILALRIRAKFKTIATCGGRNCSRHRLRADKVGTARQNTFTRLLRGQRATGSRRISYHPNSGPATTNRCVVSPTRTRRFKLIRKNGRCIVKLSCRRRRVKISRPSMRSRIIGPLMRPSAASSRAAAASSLVATMGPICVASRPGRASTKLVLSSVTKASFKAKFEARIKELVENLPDLAILIEPLLIVRRALREQVVILHRRLLAIVRDDAVCWRLMTTPGVGPWWH